MSESRTVRIFISSTFRDFGAERDLLVRQVFPALRAQLQDRFVELVDVDLRWGITAEQAERGEVLPICLAEIERSRPYFVGLLGERYGWTPAGDAYSAELLAREPWLEQHRGGKSVTELEVLHGVLNNPAMAGRALFYFRSADYAQAHGGDYLPGDDSERTRQAALKVAIRASGFPLVEGYPDPAALAERLGQDLWRVLDATFPPEQAPDAFTRTARQHEAYAAPRRRLYLGGEQYVAALDAAVASAQPRILIEGASGGGKSALVANWLSRWRAAHPADLMHEHYLAAASDAAESASLVRRFVEAIRRETGAEETIPPETDALFESLPTWLATASAHASRLGCRWIVVLDGLNGLTDMRDLRWFPAFLPERIHLVVSCLPGPTLDALDRKGAWHRVPVEALTPTEAQTLLVRYLGQYNKVLSREQLRQALSHPLSTNPLFLRTLAEELRVFGVYEQLTARLLHYLASGTVAELFGRMLARVEEDCGRDSVRQAVVAIWASRSGLGEKEIQGFAGLVPATWAPIRLAMAESLLETNGRLTFAHDYLRQAVTFRYLPVADAQRDAHRALAQWFAQQPVDARAAEELPWQWQRAEAWDELEACLLARRMFEVMTNGRGQELLGYWLELERRAGRDLQRGYAAAWADWTDAEKAEPEWQSSERQLAWAKVARNLSNFLSFAGHYSELGTSLARTALDICEAVLGAEHVDTADGLESYAMKFVHKGDERAALPYLRRALAVRERLQGPGHAETINALRNLGARLREAGEYAEAEQVLRRALELKEKSDTPDDGNFLNSLAVLLDAQGDERGAEAMLRRALERSERIRGPENPGTLQVRRNLGMALASRGDLRSAEPMIRQALEAQKRILGDRHPQTIRSMFILASRLADMGEYEQSEELFWRVLNLQEAVLGRQHPEIGETLALFASMLQKREHYAVAALLAQRASKIVQAANGPEHPDTLAVRVLIASLLASTGDRDGAELQYRQVLAIWESKAGADHPATLAARSNLALLLDEKGDRDGALAAFREVLESTERIHGPEHPFVVTALHNLAATLREAGEVDAAIPLYERALAIAEAIFGPDHPSMANALGGLGLARKQKGDYAAAAQCLRRLLAIETKSQGDDSKAAGDARDSLVEVLSASGDLAEAQALCRQALEIATEKNGPDHVRTWQALVALTDTMIKARDFGSIEPFARRALEIVDRDKDRGPEHTDAIRCIDNLGYALRARRDFEGAAALYRRRLFICEKQYGPQHDQTAAAHWQLARMLDRTGNRAAAEWEYRSAFEIHERIGGANYVVANTTYELGRMCADQDRLAEAERWLRRSLGVAQDDEDTARTCAKLSEVLYGLGTREFARKDVAQERTAVEEALELRRRALALSPRENDPQLWGELQGGIGLCSATLARLDGGRARYKEAMDAFAAAREVWPDDAQLQDAFMQMKAAYERG